MGVFGARIVQKNGYKPLEVSNHVVRPWGVEPQSKEPESFILSIELRAHFSFFVGKSSKLFVVLQKHFPLWT